MINFLRRLVASQPEHSAPPTIALFLSGSTIPEISAALLPGVGGPALLVAQREIEEQIRQHILGQEHYISELETELANAVDAG